MKTNLDESKICIIGLGYVGLPLVLEFAKKYDVVGYDVNTNRINELNKNYDRNNDFTLEDLSNNKRYVLTDDPEKIKSCNIYIITVPTPVDFDNQPVMDYLIQASNLVSENLKKDDLVIYESTVYPGATEEVCIPCLSKSNLKLNEDFMVGYSPERVNPGDKKNTLTNIIKIVSGSNAIATECVNKLYGSIIHAGTYVAESIRVAEAAKVVENVQRDVNIALVNELFQLFSKLNISTKSVINAAATKWNFMKVYPGLVGGHCIGVDPYYLLSKSESVGYLADLITKSRKLNDAMSEFIFNEFLKFVVKNKIIKEDLSVALLGFTFKENTPDLRNTKVYDLYNLLVKNGFSVQVYDDVANEEEVMQRYGIKVVRKYDTNFDVALLAVPHKNILSYYAKCKKPIYDFKEALNK